MAGLQVETRQIVRLADRDLSRLWRLVAEGASAKTALHDLLPAIVSQYGAMGAALAAEWYDDLRAKAGARGRFEAVPVESGDRGAHALIGWALDTATDDAGLQALILGGVQRRIADHLRETVAASSIVDPAAQGWIRVGRGECDWCQQYLDGEVRMVEGYDFPAHDNCNCSVEPAF